MAQLETAAGGEAAVVDTAAAASVDPIEALADSFFDEEEKQGDAPADDGTPADDLTADDLEVEPDADEAPAIKPPVSWTDEEKAVFAELPPEAQKAVARREAERERFVQSKAGEAAQATARASREAAAITAQAEQFHLQQLSGFLVEVPAKPSYQMQNEDPYAYADLMQAHENAIAHNQSVEQMVVAARQRKGQAENFLRQQTQQETYAVLSEKFPEFYDPNEGPKLREKLGSIALELGFPAENLSDVDHVDILAMKKVSEWKAKAEKLDTLMSQKMEKVREAKNLPRLSRPGSPPTRQQAGRQAVEASFQRAKESKGRAREEAFGEYLSKSGQL